MIVRMLPHTYKKYNSKCQENEQEKKEKAIVPVIDISWVDLAGYNVIDISLVNDVLDWRIINNDGGRFGSLCCRRHFLVFSV